ncbi:hypothetical protein QBC38DRAFT_471103 [Podospora fimiseda]|uniref:Translation initiation factor 3 N-terminal domain-containing protein n=1 Tax=Podospora fimiseda TaxID=252190 RepID=A0AAN7BUK9_9PEZI|nr:hypothetical protein QBC38DRAFT_471103 [Podospora fimiseda]
MRPSSCLFNSAAALQRIVVGTSSVSEATAQLQRVALRAKSAELNGALRRQISSTPTRHDQYFARSIFAPPRSPGAGKIKFGEGYQPKNDEIRYPKICLKLSRAEGGGISEPQPTRRVLNSYNHETHNLVLRVEPNPEEERFYPICEIVDKKAEYKAMMDKKKKQKQAKADKVTKELEINWASAPNDLNTKLKQLKKFLNKGIKVELKMASQQKKSKKKASLEEMKAVMATVEAAIADITGTREYKEREGILGKSSTVTIFLQGTKVKDPEESDAKRLDANNLDPEELDVKELDAAPEESETKLETAS